MTGKNENLFKKINSVIQIPLKSGESKNSDKWVEKVAKCHRSAEIRSLCLSTKVVAVKNQLDRVKNTGHVILIARTSLQNDTNPISAPIRCDC